MSEKESKQESTEDAAAEVVVDTESGDKRKREDEDDDEAKKMKAEDDKPEESKPEPAPVAASTEGTSVFDDNDVLSGRGGGTNVHPGNRNFRDLINLHRRAYLKARKNDKPAISRAIVRTIRESNGRFLKKDEKSGLWFEIGDDAAREKTSQALRQRAPEMRKLLFDTEREEARVAAEEHMRQQQRMMMGMPPEMMAQMQNMPGMNMGPGGAPMFPNPAMLAQMANGNGKNSLTPEQYQQMFQASMMGMGGQFPPGGNQPGGEGDASAAPGDSKYKESCVRFEVTHTPPEEVKEDATDV